MPMRTAFSLACLSITISLASFSNSATLFRQYWQRFFKNPQRFFRCTHGRFLHIPFLYLTDVEFATIRELAEEVLARNPPPALYPDITYVYTSATYFASYGITGVQLPRSVVRNFNNTFNFYVSYGAFSTEKSFGPLSWNCECNILK